MGKKKSNITLAALISTVFTYYLITSVVSDAVYVFGSEALYNNVLTFMGILALAFIILTFIYAVKEKNWPLLFLFVIIIILIFGGVFL